MTPAFLAPVPPRIHSRTLPHLSSRSRRPLLSRPPPRHATISASAAPVVVPVLPPAPFPSPALLSSTSSLLSSLVLCGSLLYKLPQLLRIHRSRSATGISSTMFSLETLATSFSAIYFLRRSFPFATYGELFFILAQNIAILAQITVFQKHDRRRAAAVALAYAALCTGLITSAPPAVLAWLQVAAIPILNAGRIPQILLSWRRKSTGELSLVTLALQVAGNLARVFTTITTVGDGLMLLGVSVSTLFNSVLLGQWVRYNWGKGSVEKAV